MNTAKVLSCEYSDHSGYMVLRVYMPSHYNQAELDLVMLESVDIAGEKLYRLTEVQIFLNN